MKFLITVLVLCCVSINAQADTPALHTEAYCVEQSNPTGNKALFVIITEENGYSFGNVGTFEEENGGLGPKDSIICPAVRFTTGVTPVKSGSSVAGYTSGDFELDFDAPPSANGSVRGHFSNKDMYKVDHLPMICTLAAEFPYVCVPHPYHGE